MSVCVCVCCVLCVCVRVLCCVCCVLCVPFAAHKEYQEFIESTAQQPPKT